MIENIIGHLSKNGSTSAVYQECGSAIQYVHPKKYGGKSERAVGETFYVPAFPPTSWAICNKLQELKEGQIVFIRFSCPKTSNYDELKNYALADEIIIKYCFDVKKAKAILVDGPITDAEAIKDYPVWATGTSIKTLKHEYKPANRLWEQEETVKTYQLTGGVTIIDSNGAAIIPVNMCKESTLALLQANHKVRAKQQEMIIQGKSPLEILYGE